MLFLFFTILFRLCNENIMAQKYRMDYMFANKFETFYRLHDLATNWYQARQICESEGTTLLIPENLDEMENLKLLMSNMKAHYTDVYIGLHDRFSTGHWVTVKGQPIVNSYDVTQNVLNLLWAPGSPDNSKGNEHCAVMTREGLLDDRPCSDINPFVCKIYGNATKYNKECNNFDMDYKLHKNGKCYKFHDDPLSWHKAYLTCTLEEGQLAIIESEDESRVVTDFFSKHRYSKAPDLSILLIGYSDLMFPYQYRSIRGQTLQETGWNVTVADTLESAEEMEKKRCGAITITGQLVMVNCEQPAMFLCEGTTLNDTETNVVANLDIENGTTIDAVTEESAKKQEAKPEDAVVPEEEEEDEETTTTKKPRKTKKKKEA